MYFTHTHIHTHTHKIIPNSGWLETIGMYCLTMLEARSANRDVGRGHALISLEENPL